MTDAEKVLWATAYVTYLAQVDDPAERDAADAVNAATVAVELLRRLGIGDAAERYGVSPTGREALREFHTQGEEVEAEFPICGPRVAFARKTLGLTVAGAAKALNLKGEQVMWLETGEPVVSEVVIQALAKLYGVTESYLMTVGPTDAASYQRAARSRPS